MSTFIEKMNFTAYDAVKNYKTVNAGGVPDFVVATNGKLYRCIVNSIGKEPSANPTEWLDIAIGSEIGSIIIWADTSLPAGHLACEGGSFDTTVYATLFAILGYKYGGAGASFNVPDYRGEFLRGLDNGKGTDPDAGSRTDRGDGTTGDNVGTKEADEYASHAHTIVGTDATSFGSISLQSTNAGAAFQTADGTGVNGGNESRPVNVNVKYLIKYV